jgi:hypothetical protein
VRHFVSMSVVERPGGVETQPADAVASPPPPGPASSSLPPPPSDELERVGPRHTLEIHTITAEQTLILGSTDRSVIDAWLGVLSKAVGTASAAGEPPRPAPQRWAGAARASQRREPRQGPRGAVCVLFETSGRRSGASPRHVSNRAAAQPRELVILSRPHRRSEFLSPPHCHPQG